ncbi:MAG: MCP four helix bundle domain-containing protein [Betaproteobacteria bacterium]|nr:MCP four helix bundle domain-containing protein [Betaproteobacteria bacterium]
MEKLSLQMKLNLLVGLALIALLIVAGVGLVGMRTGTSAIHEIGENRLPSVENLQELMEFEQTIHATNLITALYENDPQPQEKLKLS